MRYPLLILAALITGTLGFSQHASNRNSSSPDSIATHKVRLDSQSKLLSWIQPQANAYDKVLRDRWDFIFSGIPMSPGPAPRSDYPQFFFYCAYKDQQMKPDTWMNDVGEKIPNWFESARLFYQYTGDARALKIVTEMASYAIDHGTSPDTAAWANFPYTTTNAGDTIFSGFTTGNKFVQHEVQIDHAGDMGLAYYRLFLITGQQKFKTAAVNIAKALIKYARTGDAHHSVWPYRVITDNGRVTAPYGANWIGCYELLNELSRDESARIAELLPAMKKARDFLLQYPFKTGYWTDGHTDTDITSDTYKSNMSASNATLYLFDHPEFDPQASTDIPALIGWTEKNFIEHCSPGEPSHQWGAGIVGEQDTFLVKMDYQTARYAAECARWYALSGDTAYREKAYRSLNWVTYCTDTKGMAFESPLSSGITSWWSDCYGEGPRMFYHALAAVPEWAPAHQDHILYSNGILNQVEYKKNKLEYIPAGKEGTEYIRLSFKPSSIAVDGHMLAVAETGEGYSLKKIAGNDYSLIVRRAAKGKVTIK